MTRCSILIAPDSFKGSLTALEAAEAIAQGARRAWPEATFRLLPLSDGGEGFLDCIRSALEVEERSDMVTGANGSARRSRWLYEPATRHAWLETAEIVPLCDVGPERVACGTSRGVGELIRIAADHGAARISLGIGGTGTVDGGAGCLIGLGAGLFDAQGIALDPGSERLGQVSSIEHLDPGLPEIELLCDVRSPMIGPRGAGRLYGPQKGLDPDQVNRIEEALCAWAQLLDATFGCDPSELPFAGAGGGLAGALMAACGAVPRSGMARLGECIDLDAAIADSTILVTGEGRVDAQSAEGKVVDHLLNRAQQLGRPVQVLAGRIDADARRWLAERGARSRACAPDTVEDATALAEGRERLVQAAYEVFEDES